MAGGLRDKRWVSLRREILARDSNTCYICGSPDAGSVDHIFPRSKGGALYDPENLAAIWKWHHTEMEVCLKAIELYLAYCKSL